MCIKVTWSPIKEIIECFVLNFWVLMRTIHSTWGYHRTPPDYPLSWVSILFSSVDAIFSNRLNNSRQLPYFSYYYACGKSTFKTTIKTKTTYYLKKTYNKFSHSLSYWNICCCIKIHNWIIFCKNRSDLCK